MDLINLSTLRAREYIFYDYCNKIECANYNEIKCINCELLKSVQIETSTLGHNH